MTGAAVASAATGAVGMKRGSDAADDAAASAAATTASAHQLNAELKKMGEQGVEMAQGMLDNWESTFGGIQENLATYYDNLDPAQYATQAKQGYQTQMDKSMKQMNDSMAASGLQTSGMKAQSAQEAAFQQAQGNAAIDIGAEDKVRGMQQGFLNFGEGQRNSANSAMDNALTRQGNYATTGASGITGAQNMQTQMHSNSQTGYMGMAGDMMGGALGLGINGGFGGATPSGNAGSQVMGGYSGNNTPLSSSQQNLPKVF